MELIHYLTTDNKLKIIQKDDKNSYTFDSLLLVSFITLNKKTKKVIDFCTGNAPIPLLLTRKKNNLQIEAIEIQEEVANLGIKSVKMNGLENTIKIYNDNLINIHYKLEQNKYDLVTCNPPYFKIDETSNLNVNDSIAIARHELEVNLENIIAEAYKLLTNDGRLVFVHRPQRIDEIILLLDKYNFVLKRIKLVYPKLGKEANTILVEASKKKVINNKVRIEEPLFVYTENNEYTKEALQIINC